MTSVSTISTLMPLALHGLLTTVVLAVTTWLLSLLYKDVSIVDRAWSLLILAAGVVYLTGESAPASGRGLLVIGLVTLWAVRLAAHITWRSWGHPEDRRYQEIRARNQPNFAIKSLYLVFLLQALLAWIVSWSVLGSLASARPLGWVDGLGAALCVFGITFEAIADWQLLRFLAGESRSKSGDKSAVLDSGLWAFSRHPNYFGEFCTWWGVFVIACAAGGWWSILSPLLMSVLLLKVSGVTLLEQGMTERRPKYRHYAATVNAFFPGPPHQPAPRD